jgi:hypothetical protein
MGLVILMLVATISVVAGAILTGAEGWNIVDGIYYTFSSLFNLQSPLTTVTPTTVGGAVIDIILSSFAFGCFAVFVDYVKVLNLVHYLRK